MSEFENFNGTGVALVTPFNSDGDIDYQSLNLLIEHVQTNGVDYLVVMGTTGESPTITASEKIEILNFVLEKAKIPVVYGLGGNDTNRIKQELLGISNLPISGILSVVPYYSKPSQEGLFQHFSAIATQSRFPVILYDVPSRTGIKMEVETILDLSRHKNIVGIKDASGELSRIPELLAGAKNFLILSGDDELAFETIKMGGHGVISVLGNLMPLRMSNLVAAALNGNLEEASRINNLLQPAFALTTKEGNPTSIKGALSEINLCGDHMRLPLVPATEALKKEFLKII